MGGGFVGQNGKLVTEDLIKKGYFLLNGRSPKIKLVDLKKVDKIFKIKK